MRYIAQVRYGNDRKVITHMKYTEILRSNVMIETSKEEMIKHINKNPNTVKTKYLVNDVWKEGDKVIVVENDYLRTDGNNIKADNLGNLPEY